MPIAGLVKPRTYRDSVSLMVLSTALADTPGVLQASVMMATPANVEILRATGLFAHEFAAAEPNDLLLAVEARDEPSLNRPAQRPRPPGRLSATAPASHPHPAAGRRQ